MPIRDNSGRLVWECGQDFCQDCGDCLACHGGEVCALSLNGSVHPTFPSDDAAVEQRRAAESE